MLTRFALRSRTDAPAAGPAAPEATQPTDGDGITVVESHGVTDLLRRVTSPFRRRGVVRAATIAAAVFLALLVLTIGERVMYRGRVLPGVYVDGVDSGGASEATVLGRTTAVAQELEHRPLRARAEGAPLAVDPSVIDYRVDAAATTRAARRAGRDANPFGQVLDFVMRRVRPERVPLHVSYDTARLRGLVDGWNAQVAQGVQDGGVVIDGTNVEVIEPRTGRGILTAPALARLDGALRTARDEVVVLPMGTIRPTIDREQVEAVAARARSLVAQSVIVTVGSTVFTIEPAQIGDALSAVRKDRTLELVIDETVLRGEIADDIAGLESEPQDASFTVNGGNVGITASVTGKRVDVNAIGAAILRGEKAVIAGTIDVQPRRDTAWAQSLNITQAVSSFTTYYPCCQARVKNIQHAASVLDGTIVEPGASFSLNEKLGKRSADNGYVMAPVYSTEDGFFDDYGGGVSQLSTTLWNATFFGGYHDIAHTPHSLWISRYPKGREATLNWGSIDNRFQNDSECGILMKVYAGPTSVTVGYYSCKDRTVRSDEPAVLEETPIADECVEDPSLPPGAVGKEIEHGYTGYRVEYFRYVKKGDGPEKKERWAWTYDMRKRKVACGPAAPPPAEPAPPPPVPAPAPEPTPAPEAPAPAPPG